MLELVGGPNLDSDLVALAMKGRIVIVGTGAGSEATLDLRKLMGRRARLLGTMLRARPLDEKATAMRAFAREVVPHLASGRIAPHRRSRLPGRRGGRRVRPARGAGEARQGVAGFRRVTRDAWLKPGVGLERRPSTYAAPEELVRVGHRDPAQDAVRVGLVVAHPPERRRVAVQRDRRRTLRVAHAVDVARVEVELAAGLVTVRPLADPAVLAAVEEVLEDRTLTDEDGPLRPVVVVVARVLRFGPADQPDVDVRVAVELDVVPVDDVVLDHVLARASARRRARR